MRTSASAALRAVFTGSRLQAGQFIRCRRLAISKRPFFSTPTRLQNNDPTKAGDSGWQNVDEGVIASPKFENKLQEVEEVAENANSPQTPAKPKDLSGYGSASKRASRHSRKPRDLPPLHIPKWFIEENVILREDIPDNVTIRLLKSETSTSSPPNESSTTQAESSKRIGRGNNSILEDVVKSEVVLKGSAASQTAVEEPGIHDIQTRLEWWRNKGTKPLEENQNLFYLVSSREKDSKSSGSYMIDESILHEITSVVSTTLAAPPVDQAENWVSSKSDLVLYHPRHGGSYFLDAIVQHLADVNDADLIRLDPQDIAEIGGTYVEENRDTHVKSLSSLGYDAYQAVSTRTSQVSEDNSEEDDADDIEEEDDNIHHKNSPFRNPNIVIPVGNYRTNITDILGFINSASIPGNLFGSINSSLNGKVPGQNVDTSTDLKTSHFIETVMHICEWKRGLRNGTLGKPHLAGKELAARFTTEDPKSTSTNIDETELTNDSSPNSTTKSKGVAENELTEDSNLDSKITNSVDEAEIQRGSSSGLASASDHQTFIAMTNEMKPVRGSLIIMIRDYMEINVTSKGSKFLERLHEIVRVKRKEGRRVIVIGTSTSMEFLPLLSRSGFRSIEAEPENGPTRTIMTPCHAQLSGTLDQDYKLRIGTINLRNIQFMLRRLAPMPVQVDSMKTSPLPLDEICKSVWGLDFTHHLAVMILGLFKNKEIIDSSCVDVALKILNASEKAKSSWIDHQKEEKRDTPPVKRPVNASGADNLRFLSVGESEERMKRLRKTCNTHEKKLLNGVIDPDSIRTTFADVHAPRETVEALKTLTSLSLVRPDAFGYGVLATDKIPGLLLYGPPGTGKTLLAKAVAKESGATVLEVSGSDVYDMYVGEGEKNVKAIFTLAKKLTPCIVFIDEADAILGSRGGSSNRTTHRELINQFLREWDGMNELSAFIMVATNRPFDLDEASLRRLPRRLLVDLPTEKDREAILKLHLEDEILDPAVSLAALASQTPFYSGSDLKNLAVAAALSCVREEFDHATAASKSDDPNPYKYPPKRTLLPRHFTHATEEISASISEDMGSLSAIRKFDEKFGDRKGRRKRRGLYGFETVKEGERSLSDAARVRN